MLSGVRGLLINLAGRASALDAAAFGFNLLQNGFARKRDRLAIGHGFRKSNLEMAAAMAGAVAPLDFVVLNCGSVPKGALAPYALMQKRFLLCR